MTISDSQIYWPTSQVADIEFFLSLDAEQATKVLTESTNAPFRRNGDDRIGMDFRLHLLDQGSMTRARSYLDQKQEFNTKPLQDDVFTLGPVQNERLQTYANQSCMEALKFTPQSILSYHLAFLHNSEFISTIARIDRTLAVGKVPFYLLYSTHQQEDIVIGRNTSLIEQRVLLQRSRHIRVAVPELSGSR